MSSHCEGDVYMALGQNFVRAQKYISLVGLGGVFTFSIEKLSKSSH